MEVLIVHNIGIISQPFMINILSWKSEKVKIVQQVILNSKPSCLQFIQEPNQTAIT